MNPFARLFDREHVLTPIAVEHLRVAVGTQFRSFRMVYIFGVRVMYWSTMKFA